MVPMDSLVGIVATSLVDSH